MSWIKSTGFPKKCLIAGSGPEDKNQGSVSSLSNGIRGTDVFNRSKKEGESGKKSIVVKKTQTADQKPEDKKDGNVPLKSASQSTTPEKEKAQENDSAEPKVAGEEEGEMYCQIPLSVTLGCRKAAMNVKWENRTKEQQDAERSLLVRLGKIGHGVKGLEHCNAERTPLAKSEAQKCSAYAMDFFVANVDNFTNLARSIRLIESVHAEKL